MYLFRDTKNSRTLVEASSRVGSKLATNTPPDSPVSYRIIHSTTAHRWVQSGGIHETALYTDIDGRIRRATNDES